MGDMTWGTWPVCDVFLATPVGGTIRLLSWVLLQDDATLSISAHPGQEPNVL